MEGEHKTHAAGCPVVTATAVERQARRSFEDLVGFCRQDGRTFRPFEADLLRRRLALVCLLRRLFLTSRRDRLDGPGPAPPAGYRRGDPPAAPASTGPARPRPPATGGATPRPSAR